MCLVRGNFCYRWLRSSAGTGMDSCTSDQKGKPLERQCSLRIYGEVGKIAIIGDIEW